MRWVRAAAAPRMTAGGGIEELPAVVFPDSKYVQPDPIGVLYLFDQVAYPLRRADRKAGIVERRREAVNADLHVCSLES